MSNRGIDYGFGTTNIDRETGIRYGVIPHNEIEPIWSEASEIIYPDPTCPKCGNPVNPDGPEFPESEEADWVLEGNDYSCLDCRYRFDSEEAFGDEPSGYVLDDTDYKASQTNSDPDVFVLKSPYYTRAQFCSPCAPGACYLLNPCAEGEKAYCFGHEWFESGIAPYPVYDVETDRLVEPERGE